MNDQQYQRLKEWSWKRPLSAEERALLQQSFREQPERQADWEREMGLNQLLSQLGDTPLSSNFTAQVLLHIEREEAQLASLRRHRSPRASRQRFGWPRWVIAALALGLGILSVQQYQSGSRAEMARSVERVSTVASVSDVGWLKDFDAIRGLTQAPGTGDDRLLQVLEAAK